MGVEIWSLRSSPLLTSTTGAEATIWDRRSETDEAREERVEELSMTMSARELFKDMGSWDLILSAHWAGVSSGFLLTSLLSCDSDEWC